MATHLDDEEQLENLKQWWRENRVALIAGLAIGFAAIGGWEGWNRWSDGRAMTASQMYEDLRKALTAGKDEDVQKMAERLQSDFAGTPYASAAALQLAGVAVTKDRLDEAAQRLAWVVEHSKDEGLVDLAKLRQARVLRQQNKLDEALALLAADGGSYKGLYLELRGDILLAKGDRDAARTAYTEALASTEERAANRALLQDKLSDLAVAS